MFKQIVSLVFISISINAFAVVSGNKTVCPAGCDYISVSSAMTDIRINGINGHVIIELMPNYLVSADPYFNNFHNLGTSIINTVTIRPHSSVTIPFSWTQSSNLILLDNTRYLTIDGRAGGAGAGRFFKFSSSSFSGQAISVTNGSKYNSIKYCEIYGIHQGVNNGVIMILNSQNSNFENSSSNSFLNNKIGGGDTTSTNCFYIEGNSVNPLDSIEISGNEILNYYSYTNPASGIRADFIRNAKITGNSFYQSYPRISYNSNLGIKLSNSSSCTISGNYLGGTAAFAMGSRMSVTGSALLLFDGALSGKSFVTNNSIKNISFTINTSNSSGFIQTGNTCIIQGNRIGEDADSSIVLSSSISGATFSCINIITSFNTDSIQISGNMVQSITMLSTNYNLDFNGIKLSGNFGKINISNNLIGSVVNANNIIKSSPGNCNGIQSSFNIGAASLGMFITENTIANFNITNSASTVSGINVPMLDSNSVISENSVYKLKINSTSTISTGSVVGISVSSANGFYLIKSNIIYDLENISSNVSTKVIGIYSGYSSKICNNRVYNLRSFSNIGYMYGIFSISNTSPESVIFNNQIYLSNSGGSNSVYVYGIHYSGTAATDLYYNSILISGVANGGFASAPIFKASNDQGECRNNIFCNNRSGGYAIAFMLNPYTGWTGKSNFNFIVSSSANSVSNYNNYVNSFLQFKNYCSGDKSSWYLSAADINMSSLFADHLNGDLSINPAYNISWILNGTAFPVPSINTDHSSATRSTSVSQGAADIGSDEFTPSCNPPSATMSGTITLNQSQTFSLAERTLGEVMWTAGSSLPASIDFKYFPGVNPPGYLLNEYSNAYYQINKTGGTDFTYNVTFYYDEQNLGTNSSAESNLIIAKKQSTDTIWNVQTSTVNTISNTLSVNGLRSFSDFAITNSLNPLPVKWLNFSVESRQNNIILNWSTAAEINNDHFEIEQSSDGKSFHKIGVVKGNGNTDLISDYEFKTFNFTNEKILYYRLKQIDFNGLNTYSVIKKIEFENEMEEYSFWYDQNLKTIQFSSKFPTDTKIAVIDLNGKIIKSADNSSQMMELNDCIPGIYLIQLSNSNNPSIRKIVVY